MTSRRNNCARSRWLGRIKCRQSVGDWNARKMLSSGGVISGPANGSKTGDSEASGNTIFCEDNDGVV